jgi:hypothetical protein
MSDNEDLRSVSKLGYAIILFVAAWLGIMAAQIFKTFR